MNLMLLIPLGVLFLAAAIIPSVIIVRRLPRGATRRRWLILLLLILGFITGYIWFFLDHSLGLAIQEGMLVRTVIPLILFCGSLFVLLVSFLSLQTLQVVMKISRLEHETITDPLMGICNRRGFETRLKGEFARARRYGLDLSLLLIDIDHFKTVNDTIGHRAADVVLERLGAILKESIRDFDIAARYGGDELAVISPNSKLQEAFALASRLKELIGKYDFAREIPELKGAFHCSVSIGVASLEDFHQHPDDLVRSADSAMYLAKQQGRNRVCDARACVEEEQTGE